MQRAVLIEGALFLVLGLVGTTEGIRLVNKVDPDSIKDVLGPGYYIIVLGAILMLIGIVHAVANWKPLRGQKAEGTGMAAPWMSTTVAISMLAVFALYVILIYTLGYLVATCVFFLLEFRLAGVTAWKKNLLATVVVVAVFYVIFIYYCNLSFPHGLLVKKFFS